MDELLSEFALAHVEGSATLAAYASDDLLERHRPMMQRWTDCIASCHRQHWPSISPVEWLVSRCYDGHWTVRGILPE